MLSQARAQGLLSDEHFTVDGTLIEAWAGHKSFKRKDHTDSPRPRIPKTRRRGVGRVGWMFTFAFAAYNLVRLRNLAAA